ncbi:hypothetical protein C3K47_11140 [Solitalea longa]|uniref:CopG family transcriptional regulator n=1 Tax=Solitalea longa TaxID=2079460 RepID=A0A2S5A142_9SPHI|nr:hypothetical protein [Solitalea longa]POY36301.1 hypothetical protein C3K47_11140 [Solitalea longa]
MKTLSLKLETGIFSDVEKITEALHIPRNRYINEALDAYNQVQKRNLLKEKFKKESALVRSESIKVLSEFEALNDEFDH